MSNPAQTILVIGSQGQVGSELLARLPQVEAVKVISLSRSDLDLTQVDQLAAEIERLQPTVILNAAAYTAVDRAETETELAYAINAIAPKVMAETAQKLGATLVHISTDYVFDGKGYLPYLETDSTNPQSVYGQSKRAGEVNVQEACDRHLILRTAWVHSAYGKGNFVKTMLRLGKDRSQLKVVSDQIGSPTWAGSIAEVILEALPKLNAETYGTYHFTNSGVASWYDLAIATFEEARSIGFELQVQEVLPIGTQDYPLPAPRPAYSVLNGSKMSTLLGHPAEHWRSALTKMIRQEIRVE